MKLHEMFQRYSFDAVWTRLVNHYPDMGDSKQGFINAWVEIQTLNPNGNPRSDIKEIRARRYYEKNDKKWYVHVSGAGKTEPSWSLMGTDWEEMLSYDVNDGDINKLGAINTLAHILWEITWGGFSRKHIAKFSDDLDDKANRIEYTHKSEK